MVRRVEVEGIAVNAAAHSFGFSRQSYYSAAAALADGGLPALVPAKPGPRRAHKLSDQVLDHLEALQVADPTLRLSLIHISEPTRRTPISYAVFCLKKKKNK